MFFAVVFIILPLVLLLVDTVLKRNGAKFARTIPTIEPCYPLLGNSLMFLGKSEQQRFEGFESVFRKVNRIGKGWLGPQLVFCVSHPDLVHKILNDANCCAKPFFYDFVQLDHGLFAAKYHLWKPYRKALNPTFNAKILLSFVALFELYSRKMVEKMKLACDGEPVDILEYTSECALEMVCGTTLGTNLFEREGKHVFLENMKVLSYKIATRILSVSLYNDTIYRMTNGYHEEKSARKFCLDYTLEIIKERRVVLNQQQVSKDDEDGYEIRQPKIFIDQVLSGVESAEVTFNAQNLSEQILTIIAAGHDTSAQNVAHACLFLAMFPDFQEQLHDEIIRNLPDNEQHITPEALKNLPFLDKFLKESMRLAPVGSITARTNLVEIELDGACIPAGNVFVFNMFTMHRREDMWGSKAEQFDPENFSPERLEGRHPFAYMPFSGGSRNCIGARYAMLSNKIMIVHIVRNFRLSTKIRFEDLRYLLDITLHLAFQHMIKLERR